MWIAVHIILLAARLSPLLLALPLGLAFAVLCLLAMEAWKRWQQAPALKAQSDMMKSQMEVLDRQLFELQVKLQVHGTYLQDYRDGSAALGTLEGYRAFLQELMDLKQQALHGQVSADALREKSLLLQQQMEKNVQLMETNTRLHQQRNRYMMALEEKRRGGADDGPDDGGGGIDTSSLDHGKIMRFSSADPDPNRPRSSGNPAENMIRTSGAGSEPYIPDLPDRDTRYKLEHVTKGGYSGEIRVISKISLEEVARFKMSDLRRGVTHAVRAEGLMIYVVWCGLPSCDHVIVTKHSNTRVCSVEHSRKYDMYLKLPNASGQ